jgi:AcrR family transcriptional regulator
MPSDGERREQILETAASLLASSGIRTSLKEIGDACGILPGSLYHHFESKDALIIELVQRYRDELDDVATKALASLSDSGLSVEDRVSELGEAIAVCAVRNRAALLLTLYDPPATASNELVRLAQQTPAAAIEAMTEVIEAGRSSGEIRLEIDSALLGERICQSMLHVGVGVFHRSHAAKRLPTMKCQVFLHGVARRRPTNASLDRSTARMVADEVIAGWTHSDGDDRESQLRAAGRTEFGRRGYEATTMRDIAKSAGLTTGTVYRTYRSKDDLLVAIMQTFSDTFSSAWDAVIGSSSTVVEKLDGLLWVNINLLERFGEEFKIQLAWLRQLPPDSVELGLSFGKQVRQLQTLLVAGEAEGKLTVGSGSAYARTRSMYELLLTPATVISRAGAPAALALARDTVLRGALVNR